MFRANLSRTDDETRKPASTQNLVFIALRSEQVNRGGIGTSFASQPICSQPFFDLVAKCACDHSIASHHFKYFHDFRLVRPSEVPQRAPLQGDLDQLAHRVCRVLLSSACEPNWVLRVQCRAIEDDSGSDHAKRFLGVFRPVFERANPLELCDGICNDRGAVFVIFKKW